MADSGSWGQVVLSVLYVEGSASAAWGSCHDLTRILAELLVHSSLLFLISLQARDINVRIEYIECSVQGSERYAKEIRRRHVIPKAARHLTGLCSGLLRASFATSTWDAPCPPWRLKTPRHYCFDSTTRCQDQERLSTDSCPITKSRRRRRTAHSS